MAPSVLRWRLAFGVLLLNLGVLALTAYSLYRDRIQYEERTTVATQNLARLLEHDVTAVFDRVNLLLHVAERDVEDLLARGPLQAERVNAVLGQHLEQVPEAMSLRMIDAQGVIRHGRGVTAQTQLDASDREHFIRARDDAKAGLVIARPVQGRINREWVIPVSRRLDRPDGSFAGVVYASVPVEYFVKLFAELNVGSRGLVALRNLDYVVMARFPKAAGGTGDIGQVSVSRETEAMVQANRLSGTYTSTSKIDQVTRVITFQRIPAYPLYVVAGLAKEEYLHAWWQNVIETVVLTAIFLVTSMLLAYLLYRAWMQQWEAGQSLKKSEELWSFALEGGGYSVWDWDLTSGRVELSKRGKQLFGFADDEIGDDMREWEARLHPDDKPRVLRDLRSHLRGVTPGEATEFRVRGKDGGWRWILTRGTVVSRDAHGRVTRMIGTHVDVTERREREEALSLAATVFDIADEGVMVTDAQNRIISVNPAFTAITGYAPADVLGHDPRMLSSGTQPAAFYEELWDTLERNGSWRGEMVNRKKNGEVYIEWLSIKGVRDAGGRLTHYAAVFTDITARKAVERRMHHLALHDALTDLPNRALLTERLEQAMAHARRDKTHLGLMYFDLDQFKPVNDNLGHDKGDQLLQAVAERVRACVRTTDTVARMGGDEFVVLLSSVQEEQDALAVAEKVREALGQPFTLDGHVLRISSSIGVAVYPQHGQDGETLLRRADAAMYQAKRDGRDRAVLYHSGP